MKRRIFIKNISITVIVLILAIIVSIFFQRLEVMEHITTIFIFAVFLISLTTDGYLYGIAAGIVGMLATNYAFTYPYLKWDFMTPVHCISAVIMIIIVILTGTVTVKHKEHEAMKIEGEKERMRANLLRAVSHDLRTPLTTIYGASCTLADNENSLSEEQRTSMQKSIQEDSLWLIRMLENILSVTRIDDGRVKIIKTPTVVDELIDAVASKFSARYPEKELQIEIPDGCYSYWTGTYYYDGKCCLSC